MKELIQGTTAADVAELAADLFVESSKKALEERGMFVVALAGGTTPAATHRLLAAPPRASRVNWEKVHVFFGDERRVPAGDRDRNDAAATEELLSHVPVPSKNVHPVPVMRPDAAEIYEAEIRSELPFSLEEIPRFDLVFLGMGPDGHTASLFPGYSALEETRRLVVKVTGAPKPPPDRVTFTLPLINVARCVTFLVTGEDKKEALARVLSGDKSLPAARVLPRRGRLLFLVDESASPSKHAAQSVAQGLP